MKNLVALILFLIIAGLMTQRKTNHLTLKSFNVPLNKESEAQAKIFQNQTDNSLFLVLENMSGEFSSRGLPLMSSLRFELGNQNCHFTGSEKTGFYCIPQVDEIPIATQKLRSGKMMHLLGFSSYLFKGKVFNSINGEFEDHTIYKTSIKLRMGNQIFALDFHTPTKTHLPSLWKLGKSWPVKK